MSTNKNNSFNLFTTTQYTMNILYNAHYSDVVVSITTSNFAFPRGHSDDREIVINNNNDYNIRTS